MPPGIGTTENENSNASADDRVHLSLMPRVRWTTDIQNAVRGEPFDKLRTGPSNHERPFDKLRAKGIVLFSEKDSGGM